MFMNVYHGKDVIDIQLEEKGDTCFFFQKSEIYLTLAEIQVLTIYIPVSMVSSPVFAQCGGIRRS